MKNYNKQWNSSSREENPKSHDHGHKNNHHGKKGGHGGNHTHRNGHSHNNKPQSNQNNRIVAGPSGEPPITSFMLGEKELDNKKAQFLYDKGNYSIVDIVGEEKTVIYKSRNSEEAYQKWNVYIGRKKERMRPGDKQEKNTEAQ